MSDEGTTISDRRRVLGLDQRVRDQTRAGSLLLLTTINSFFAHKPTVSMYIVTPLVLVSLTNCSSARRRLSS
jgi:hypothetical protein